MKAKINKDGKYSIENLATQKVTENQPRRISQRVFQAWTGPQKH